MRQIPQIPQITLIGSVIILFLFGALASAADSPLLSSTNERDHLVTAFQVSIAGERIFEGLHFSKSSSILLSSAVTLTGAFAKELIFDAHLDSHDIWVAVIGSSISGALALIWPDQEGSNQWLFFEPDVGPLYINTLRDSSYSMSPPPSFLFQFQSTFWLKHWVGLHIFSGGYETSTAHSDQDEERLLIGAGFRFSLFPFPWKTYDAKPHFSSWIGIDYGYLLYALDTTNVIYKPSSRVPFFSAGIKWRPGSSKFHLGWQNSLVPYDGNLLYVSGLNLGLDL